MLLFLKDVFLQHHMQMVDVKLEMVVLMEVITEMVIVCHIFHVNKVKFGIMIWLTVFVLKELNGMEINA